MINPEFQTRERVESEFKFSSDCAGSIAPHLPLEQGVNGRYTYFLDLFQGHKKPHLFAYWDLTLGAVVLLQVT